MVNAPQRHGGYNEPPRGKTNNLHMRKQRRRLLLLHVTIYGETAINDKLMRYMQFNHVFFFQKRTTLNKAS